MSSSDSYAVTSAAASILRRGGLVALPTETVYGLGANAFDARAVAKIFAAKERPFFDPLIVHLAESSWWPRVVLEFPPRAEQLAKTFWPGPLTMVLPKTPMIPDIVTSGLPHVAIRVPDHPLARDVLRLADVPIAAPSANLFGRLSPTTAEHVRQQLGDRVDFIVDGGPCRVGIESTIVQFEGDTVICLRPGGITLEEIESVVGPVRRPVPSFSDERSPAAPGMLASHYAPRTRLRIVDDIPRIPPSPRMGLLILQPCLGSEHYAQTEILSQAGDLMEAASTFFNALHRLDGANLDLILAVPLPDIGLGISMNDRLRRAAHEH
jgi:L-threonylcarbamoyladenylate synthase